MTLLLLILAVLVAWWVGDLAYDLTHSRAVDLAVTFVVAWVLIYMVLTR